MFISSTIDELKDERLIVKECVKQFGFEPAMFEEWGARSSGLRQTYIDDAMNSDLYVGIFNKEYSAPTIEEYETARAHNIDIMIYVKKLAVGRREKKLQSFIKSISEPDEGHVLCYFDDIMDLKAKVKSDLTYWIARIVGCKTSKELEKYSMTEMILALDSMVANKIVVETGEKYNLDSDFKNEFVETFTKIIAKEKRPINFVIVKECLAKAIILAMMRKMRTIHESVVPIYVNLFTCFLSGGRLNHLVDHLTNVVGKAKQEEAKRVPSYRKRKRAGFVTNSAHIP